MKTLKEECIYLHLFSSFEEAKALIESWIDGYNKKRPQQVLGYLSGVQYLYRP